MIVGSHPTLPLMPLLAVGLSAAVVLAVVLAVAAATTAGADAVGGCRGSGREGAVEVAGAESCVVEDVADGAEAASEVTDA